MSITKKVLLIILLIFLTSIVTNNYWPVNNTNKLVEVHADLTALEKNQILVSFLPLTKGEATLIQLTNNEFYLIDTGAKQTSNQLILLLKDHGVKNLKGIFLTNFSDEHLGGLKPILQQFQVETIYIPKLTASSFKIPAGFNAEIKELIVNEQISLINNTKIVVLAPTEPLSLTPQDNSMVLHLIHQDTRFLFTSEITGAVEQKLVNQYDLKSEILKVSDYGSNAGSIPEFIDEVDAQVSIIFNNDKKSYKLSEDVLERLHQTWTDIYILERYGEVQIISDGRNYTVKVIDESEEE